MPELPEVETIVRGLTTELGGRKIARVTYVSDHLLRLEPRLTEIGGDTLESFSRRGKYIITSLKSDRKLLIHLRMTGCLVIKSKWERRGKHDHLAITFANWDRKLVFRDLRKFGVVQFYQEGNGCGLDSLGPEATQITARELHLRFRKSNRPVKLFLLDQTKIAGLGNIYVDESLHRARIHPLQNTAKITLPTTARLVRAMRHILREAIKHLGTTFDSYRGANGNPGEYRRYLRVYHNTGNKCRSCGGVIEKIKLGGRGTHFCPTCQKLST
ncbi:MAG: bifunctional DNA-formamidopyrimidine glycosylase/DNA-(apurinic or apyrimidinic site) lyase [candidate division Zixibacteria bacterium]|nr:bifunctional DNA-formamidopyrimidine glycosylase/DNA-(apurinic or apyrimidinic site) lyase [candidate division Zixibacteria bacterium]